MNLGQAVAIRLYELRRDAEAATQQYEQAARAEGAAIRAHNGTALPSFERFRLHSGANRGIGRDQAAAACLALGNAGFGRKDLAGNSAADSVEDRSAKAALNGILNPDDEGTTHVQAGARIE